jgi:hypothetical protein
LSRVYDWNAKGTTDSIHTTVTIAIIQDGSISDSFFVGRRGSRHCIDGIHEIQIHVNDVLIPDRCIDPGVVYGTVRPFDVEILPDEIVALAVTVTGIHGLMGFRLTLAASQEAPHFMFSRRVKKPSDKASPSRGVPNCYITSKFGGTPSQVVACKYQTAV